MEITTDFKAKKAYEGVNLKCARDKYAQILSIFFQICPKNVTDNIFSSYIGEFFTKDWIASQI